MNNFLLGLACGIGACCTFAIACGLIDIHRWDRRRCAHSVVGHDEWGTTHCLDCHRTLRCWPTRHFPRQAHKRWLWRWPMAIRDNCNRCRWKYYTDDPDDNAHLHQREIDHA